MLNAGLSALLACAVLACGGPAQQTGLATLRPACAEGTTWNGASCVAWGPGEKTAARGQAELEEGKLDAAIESFTRAVLEGPHAHAAHVRIFAELGIAYGYKEDEAAATAAFTKLLLLDPRHVLSYNEPPQATLKFERARAQLADKPVPTIDVSLPAGSDVSRPIPIGVEVVADPTAILRRATLYVRDPLAGETRAADLELAPIGERREVVLPALGGNTPRTLTLHLVARDERGSEVLLWASEAQPREIQVDYTPPTPLLEKWWFWAAVGGVVAVGAGTTAYLLTREPGPIVPPGDFTPPAAFSPR